MPVDPADLATAVCRAVMRDLDDQAALRAAVSNALAAIDADRAEVTHASF